MVEGQQRWGQTNSSRQYQVPEESRARDLDCSECKFLLVRRGYSTSRLRKRPAETDEKQMQRKVTAISWNMSVFAEEDFQCFMEKFLGCAKRAELLD